MRFSEECVNLWTRYSEGHFIVITTNGFVKRNGEAVMGRGIAKEATIRFPGIAYAVGQAISKNGNVPLVNVKYRLITLPTKKIWTEPADPQLIEAGLKILVKMATELELEKVYMPRPGCGNGHLEWADVRPICEQHLDERFVVCYY